MGNENETSLGWFISGWSHCEQGAQRNMIVKLYQNLAKQQQQQQQFKSCLKK